MRDDVKAALHVDHVGLGPTSWPGPAPGWTYTSSYDACNQGKVTVAKSMVDFYRELAPALRGKIVVFNGDTDPCVSYEGTRTAIERVGFAIEQPTRLGLGLGLGLANPNPNPTSSVISTKQLPGRTRPARPARCRALA